MPTSHDHTSTTRRLSGRARRRATRLTLAAAIVAALAISLPALAPAATSRKGSSAAVGAFKGKTAQGLAVSLSKPVKGGRRFTYQATMTCSDGTTFTDAPFVDLVTIRNNKFHVRYTSDKGATITNVTGTIKGRRASGTVHITERYSPTPNASNVYPLDPHGTVFCQSNNVRWTATAR